MTDADEIKRDLQTLREQFETFAAEAMARIADIERRLYLPPEVIAEMEAYVAEADRRKAKGA